MSYVCFLNFYAICFSFLGYAIVQLPELIMYSWDVIKKKILKKHTVGSNKLDAHLMKCSDCNVISTFVPITRTNEQYTDLQIVMAAMESKIDIKINRAKQEILDLMAKRL